MPDPTGRVSHLPDFHRGVSWKQPCRVATTANVTISTALNAGDTIDGVTLAAGDRVLVKDQSTGSQNGIYVAGASPTRAFDMDQDGTTSVPAEEVAGAFVYVIAGTANAGKVYRATNVAGAILGTTTITWTEFSGGGVTDHGALTGLSDDDHPQYLLETAVAAKGDIYAASANDTVGVLSVGTNGQVLTADSGETLGVKWATGGSGSLDVTDGTTTVSPTSEIEFDSTDFDVTDQGSGSALVQFVGSGSGAGADGWVDDSAATWTYGSATTFTVSSDRTAVFRKGTRLKLTNSSLKYFVVVGSSHSAGTTTVTVTGGSDYSLANTTISANFYSYDDCPQGYPESFNYAPSWTGFSSNPSSIVAKFSVGAGCCSVMVRPGTNGTSNATSLTVTLPIAALAVEDFTIRGTNNGAVPTTPALLETAAGSATASCFRELAGTGWTGSGGKNVQFSIVYRI